MYKEKKDAEGMINDRTRSLEEKEYIGGMHENTEYQKNLA